LFVAIELSEGIKRELAKVQKSLADFDNTVRWTRPEQIHLTLKFLGDVPDEDVAGVASAVELAAATSQPVTLRTERPGCFPPRGNARVIWVGLTDDGGALFACQQAVESALEECDFPREDRPFTPHLTLGRVKSDRAGGRQRGGWHGHARSETGGLRERVAGLKLPPIEQDVGAIALMMSELSDSGAKHTRLGEFELRG
jgi:2'-5' RNA ligase